MSGYTRRNFLREAGASVAALSLGSSPLQAGVMPGRPLNETSGSEDMPSNIMAIAAHPGDAFFAMGAPVALATHQGGKGSLLSLSSGENGSATIPPKQYGEAQREAATKAATSIGAEALFLS